jgi:predicted nucleotidyltransferase component of viral defense system
MQLWQKKTFTPLEWLHLTELAHAAVLAGLMNARRWSPGELKFQGGTSLHLVYGSPRFSEDLNFVTASQTGMHAAVRAATGYVRSSFSREFPDLAVNLKVRNDEGVADPRNQRLFTIAISEPNWHESLKVKVEFYIVANKIAQAYESATMPMMQLRPKLRVDLPSIMIETADINEILCDKIHALGDRARIKERDIFDLWWICQQQNLTHDDAAQSFIQRHQVHLDMYPNGKPLEQLSQTLQERAAYLMLILDDKKKFNETVTAIARWLPGNIGAAIPGLTPPPNILASPANVTNMIEHAARCAICTARAIDELVQAEQPSQASRTHRG